MIANFDSEDSVIVNVEFVTSRSIPSPMIVYLDPVGFQLLRFRIDIYMNRTLRNR